MKTSLLNDLIKMGSYDNSEYIRLENYLKK